jgi:hypothetical protein
MSSKRQRFCVVDHSTTKGRRTNVMACFPTKEKAMREAAARNRAFGLTGFANVHRESVIRMWCERGDEVDGCALVSSSLGSASDDARDAGRKRALLSKPVRFQGRQMTKAQMVEEMIRQGGVLKIERFPKYTFSRSTYNRLDFAEQKKYDEKMKTRMPFAVELPNGSYFEVTQTEADHFRRNGGKAD